MQMTLESFNPSVLFRSFVTLESQPETSSSCHRFNPSVMIRSIVTKFVPDGNLICKFLASQSLRTV